jgi:HEAT repeat protein
MVRRFMAIGVVLAAALLFATEAAQAGRLGGAYRGPYGEEITQSEEETTTDVGSATAEQPKTSGSDTGGDNSGGGEGGATAGGSTGGESGGEGGEGGTGEPPPGTGGEGGEGGEGGAAPPPDAGTGGGDTGGSGGGGSKAPSAGGGGPSGPSGGGISGPGGGGGPGGGANVAQIDQKKFWTFWFEHNKEGILAELLRARAAQGAISPGSSTYFFQGRSGGRSLTPVTAEQKTEIILPVLQEACTHKSNWVRDAAVLALGKLGDEKGLEYILGRMKNDPDSDVVENSLLALGLSGLEKKAFSPLMKQMKSKDRRIKTFAALGLALLRNSAATRILMPQYTDAVRRKHDELASCLAIAIGQLGEEADVPDLAKPMKMRGREKLKVHVCQALGQIGGKKAKEILSRALSDRVPVQAAAVLALSRFPDSKIAGKLLDKGGLKSGDNQVKGFACVALGRIGAALPENDGMRKKISAALKKEAEGPQKNLYSAMYASLGLAIMGSDISNAYFEEYLDKKHRSKYRDENHSSMALAAGLLDMADIANKLRDIVRKGDIDQDYRGYAAFSLGIMGDGDSKQQISAAMKKNKKRAHLLRSGCWAIGLMGDASDVPMLIEILKTEENGMHEVRGAAAIAIGLIGDASAVEPLVKIAKNDPVTSNRAFAIAALGCLIDKDPVPRMAQLFDTINYRERYDVVKDVLQNL